MKKLIAALSIFLIAAPLYTASAHNIGDVIGQAAYSGIDTYINNCPINAYHKGGRQLICAEDLREYGFNVEWSAEERALYITPDHSVGEIYYNTDIKREYFLENRKACDIYFTDIAVYLNGNRIESYSADGRTMIPLRALETFGRCEYSAENNYAGAFIDGLPVAEYRPLDISYDKKITVVLDAGHGKSSYLMSDEEKLSEGYVYNNGWGEWRHRKNGTADEDCCGFNCRGDHSCWYSISNVDRDREPEINLRNAFFAQYYLENELGYNVRMTRTSNDTNPSFSKRVSYCYPGSDVSAAPDAAAFVSIHSNAGGGRGSACIAAEGLYTQKWIGSSYTYDCCELGRLINNRIVSETSLKAYSGGCIEDQGYLIAFNKSPVPVGYIEIGFYDNYSDLNILNSEYDAIGKAIANGINDFLICNDE